MLKGRSAGRITALTVSTVVLAALAGVGGHAAGAALRLRQSQVSPSPSATPSASPMAGPSASTGPTPSASPVPNASALLEAAKRATVKLDTDTTYGSGSIVSPDGLVVTNAHVAAPQAPGLAFHYRRQFDESNPQYLEVSVSPPGDGPAILKYRAQTLIADGYLDLAVLKITADAEGQALPTGTVFPYLRLGSSADLHTGDPVTVLGYPAVAAEGKSLSVTRGDIATFDSDEAKRVSAPRFEIDTSARIAGGNSGGAAIDAAGRLIGVPSASSATSEYSGRIRPIDFAKPLLARVVAGTYAAYRTPYDVITDGSEAGEALGWSVAERSCPAAADDTLPSGTTAAYGQISLTGMTTGEDTLTTLEHDGERLRTDPETWTLREGTGCLPIQIDATATGGQAGAALAGGTYVFSVFAGPLLRRMAQTTLTVS